MNRALRRIMWTISYWINNPVIKTHRSYFKKTGHGIHSLHFFMTILLIKHPALSLGIMTKMTIRRPTAVSHICLLLTLPWRNTGHSSDVCLGGDSCDHPLIQSNVSWLQEMGTLPNTSRFFVLERPFEPIPANSFAMVPQLKVWLHIKLTRLK